MRSTKSIILGIAAVVLLCAALGAWLIPWSILAEVPPTEQVTYFRVAEHSGTWSLEDPQNRKFFSIGMNRLKPQDTVSRPGPAYDGLAQYDGDVEKWNTQTLERLDAWKVNTIGPWSTLRGRPYVLELSLSYKWVNVFGKDFESEVETAAMAALDYDYFEADYADFDEDPLLIGYFTDNELSWGSGYRWLDKTGKKSIFSLFEYYAKMKPESGGKRNWASYLAKAYHQNWDELTSVWNVDVERLRDLPHVTRIAPRSPEHFAQAARVGDGFLRRVAERYFEVTSREMRRHLPHHLNLGVRFTRGFPDVVAEVAGRYVDVSSINVYTRDLDYFRAEVTRLFKAGGRPVLISEFAFAGRKNRSGNNNHDFEAAEVEDDIERGEYYVRCVEMLGDLPFVVGLHWFQHHDQPTRGTRENESVNFGFVDIYDREYEDLVGAATKANGRVLKLRGGAETVSIPE